ncbi:dihydropyrimidinase [Lichenihabitans sp. PAMC28606]|uniref:dihydropyrimidinase n=1 Tax=Lichenihabitans sp. PAMC28606 TaxID=2880932 RepID=UPI001D09EFBC|nr:dihydropyrimidinase [Lichenihabitans sp. PAMC28606]UDL93718.1 dihydropyrimidinase [Lichenihabitans sp. PAMC28606]
MYDLVITGGRVALDEGWADCDIGIANGRIAALGRGLRGAAIIEAAGRWVMPGGIDAHCHLDQPTWGGVDTADDFATGSISAAFGGTTCIVPFAMPGPGMTTLAALDRSLHCAGGRSVVDYGLHAVFTEATGSDVDAQLDRLAARGVPSVKAFMTYRGFAVSDDLMLAIMDGARPRGMTVMVHAENDAGIRRTTGRLVALGRTGFRYHAVAHAEAFEREATHRAATLAEITGARLVIVHVSCAQSAEEVHRARARGADVIAETCPQYLLSTAADLDGPPQEAARFIFSPPPRGRASQDALWQALSAGDIALWSSDHSPYRMADKLAPASEPSFTTAANGVPGLETRLPILFSKGLLSGRLTLARYLALAGQAAAMLYGLDDRKGRIAVGLDADLVLWDPDARWQVRHEAQHSAVDFTPYEGLWLTGKPTDVLVRGRSVIRDGILHDATPTGQFLPRHAVPADPARHPIEETTPWLEA